jgi:predicted HTH domain antitoxin
MFSQRDKRQKRIEKRAAPETVQAYRQGLISLRKADQLLYLSPARQRTELERRLSEARERENRNRLVAQTIGTYLRDLGDKRVDLARLSQIIREALNHVTTAAK